MLLNHPAYRGVIAESERAEGSNERANEASSSFRGGEKLPLQPDFNSLPVAARKSIVFLGPRHVRTLFCGLRFYPHCDDSLLV